VKIVENNFLLAEIAKLYYIDKVKQKEIADIYGIPPMLVSRYLRRAEEKGIVNFYIKMPIEIDLALGKKIKDKYKLRECLVVDINSEENIKEKIGKVAADYFISLLQEDSIIGMSWGRTIYEFAKNISPINYSNCKVVQFVGGFMAENNYIITPTNIIKMVSEKLKCIPCFFNAPFSISTEEAKMLLLDDPSNKYIMELAQSSNINIIGSGELGLNSTIFTTGVMELKDRDELLKRGAIGEIGGFPIDREGNEVIWSKSKLYTGVPLEIIKKAQNVICLSGEEEKSEVLIAGMKKKYFNVLITSQKVARNLI
jgi:deoxyribonucleoside regulator